MPSMHIVDASPNPYTSVTRELTQAFAQEAEALDPALSVTRRDLGTNPPPHLDIGTIGAFFTPPDQLTPDQVQMSALSMDLIGEFLGADLVVFGVPMHNFGMPSGFKAYVDHVVRPGLTFQLTETGPRGLVEDKRLIVVTARGGYYVSDEMRALDNQESYIRAIFGFIGIDDILFVNCEGCDIDPEARQAAITSSKTRLSEVAQQLAA
ncbi:FMN-dependent NADH-azoreductase [Mesobacterium pallidum]|uniref:FMN-dependent NADH-azoreductase n=1 Tax=Mesobacterium pallidum TaxID=2872037 RepID=UPI001EE357D8|nr:NAD(P)H-dependent oxidoreductase [Mesobacterium pallidum]